MDLKSGLVRSSSSLLSLLSFQSSSFKGECFFESLDGESRGDEVKSVGASRRCIVMFCLEDIVISLFHSSSTTRYPIRYMFQRCYLRLLGSLVRFGRLCIAREHGRVFYY